MSQSCRSKDHLASSVYPCISSSKKKSQFYTLSVFNSFSSLESFQFGSTSQYHSHKFPVHIVRSLLFLDEIEHFGKWQSMRSSSISAVWIHIGNVDYPITISRVNTHSRSHISRIVYSSVSIGVISPSLVTPSYIYLSGTSIYRSHQHRMVFCYVVQGISSLDKGRSRSISRIVLHNLQFQPSKRSSTSNRSNKEPTGIGSILKVDVLLVDCVLMA